jgi:hypothetical protein
MTKLRIRAYVRSVPVRMTPMPGRSFDDANAFHRTMRTFGVTKVGVALFRPMANRLDQLVSRLTGGRRSLAGIATGVPAVILTTTGAKSGEPRTVAVWGIPRPDGLGGQR